MCAAGAPVLEAGRMLVGAASLAVLLVVVTPLVAVLTTTLLILLLLVNALTLTDLWVAM